MDTNWTEVPNVIFVMNGNVLEATFAKPATDTRFYRIVQVP